MCRFHGDQLGASDLGEFEPAVAIWGPHHHDIGPEPVDPVDELGQGRGDILTFGSRTTWNGLLEDGLIDELHMMVSPCALAGGTPMFDVPVKLTLREARSFDGSDNVLLRYAVQR